MYALEAEVNRQVAHAKTLPEGSDARTIARRSITDLLDLLHAMRTDASTILWAAAR